LSRARANRAGKIQGVKSMNFRVIRKLATASLATLMLTAGTASAQD
jgi:hypothetical protein